MPAGIAVCCQGTTKTMKPEALGGVSAQRGRSAQ